MAFKYSFILHAHPQRCTVLWINLMIESDVWKIRHGHKRVIYRRTDRWSDRYKTITCIYLIIVAVGKKSVQSFHYHFCSFITIYIHVSYQSSKKRVAHVMPHLTCYMHACIHVVLIILIWLNRIGLFELLINWKTLNVQYILHLKNNISSR